MGKDEIARREGPDEAVRRSDDTDTEGHKRFFRDGESAAPTEGGPDEVAKVKAVPDTDDDTEGHKRHFGRDDQSATPTEGGPDEAAKAKAVPDADDTEGHRK